MLLDSAVTGKAICMNKLTNTLVFFFWALAFVCVGLMFWGILELSRIS